MTGCRTGRRAAPRLGPAWLGGDLAGSCSVIDALGVKARSSASGRRSASSADRSPEPAAAKNASTTARSSPSPAGGSGGNHAYSPPSATGEHLHGIGRTAKDVGDLTERQVEDVVQHERDTLGRGQAVHHDMQREADRLGDQQASSSGVGVRSPPWSVLAAAEKLVRSISTGTSRRVGGSEHVEADSARDRRQPSAEIARCLRRPAGSVAATPPGSRLGVIAGTEHPQRDRSASTSAGARTPLPVQWCTHSRSLILSPGDARGAVR